MSASISLKPVAISPQDSYMSQSFLFRCRKIRRWKKRAKRSRFDKKPITTEPSRFITRDIFRHDRLDLFWWFVCERQKIWHRRMIERKSPPWTKDVILRNVRFTNVYRELDPGTRYLRQNILELPVPDKDKIFNVMLYRLIGRTRTYSVMGFQ